LRCRGITQAKWHRNPFEKPVFGDKGCLPGMSRHRFLHFVSSYLLLFIPPHGKINLRTTWSRLNFIISFPSILVLSNHQNIRNHLFNSRVVSHSYGSSGPPPLNRLSSACSSLNLSQQWVFVTVFSFSCAIEEFFSFSFSFSFSSFFSFSYSASSLQSGEEKKFYFFSLIFFRGRDFS